MEMNPMLYKYEKIRYSEDIYEYIFIYKYILWIFCFLFLHIYICGWSNLQKLLKLFFLCLFVWVKVWIPLHIIIMIFMI